MKEKQTSITIHIQTDKRKTKQHGLQGFNFVIMAEINRHKKVLKWTIQILTFAAVE